jgi:hypothetical protein
MAVSSFVITLSTLTSGTDHPTYKRLWRWGLAPDSKAGRYQTARVIEARRGVVMNGAKSIALPNGVPSFALKDQPDSRIDGILLSVATCAQRHTRKT